MEWMIALLLFAALIAVAAFSAPGKCDVCGRTFKRTVYRWTIGGAKKKMCPTCNRQMERRVSRSAFKSKFGA
jgi:ribosome-binding protein aMBF1 (putative translation factor)